ncbi:hypothetical protein D3C72_2428700 [compost metagenome]
MLCYQVLHFPRGQAVPGNVDDIIGAPHDVDETVLVQVAAVAGVVVARIGLQVRLQIAPVIAPQGLAASGWQR